MVGKAESSLEQKGSHFDMHGVAQEEEQICIYVARHGVMGSRDVCKMLSQQVAAA